MATCEALPAAVLPVEGRPEPRMTLIDGLRGLAAFAVLLFHFCMAARLPFETAAWMPSPIEWVLEHLWLGVQLFFVLSGFVIAYSVRGRLVTAGFIGRFVARRSIRLDPPYWLLVGVEVGLIALTGRNWEGHAAVANGGQAAAHLVYLQEFLGYGELVGVFWTLCVEVQMYLAFILLLALAQRLSKTSGEAPTGRRRIAFLLPFLPLTAASVAWLGHGGSAMPWALGYWYMFLLGALVWWTLEGLVSRGWLFGFAAVIACVGSPLVRWEPMAAVAIATAGVTWVAGKKGTLTTWLAFRPIQYVGRISYSLYLVHLVIGDRVLRWVLESHGRSAATFLAGSALGMLASFVAAHLLHVTVERPAARWARRISLGAKSAPPPQPVEPVLPPAGPIPGVASTALEPVTAVS